MGKHGLTVSELARESGLKPAYVSHLVHGRRSNPSRRVVNRLARTLQVDPKTLMTSFYVNKKGGK